ncbi:MAG: PAS domain S-box protein [Candidatus Thorarchaeota archaeon]
MTYHREEIKENFRDLFEHSLDLIYVSDLEGSFLDANDLTLLTLGYEREEISEIKFLDLLDQEELKIAYEALKEIVKRGKQSKRREYKIKAKNGNFIYVETYAMPLKKMGKIYAILGIGKNITERKKAEQKLKESEEMFRALYKEGPIATYIWKRVNGNFILIDFNIAAEKVTDGNVVSYLGYKASEMYNNRLDIFEDLNECFNKKTHITREMKYKFQFNSKDKHLLVNYGFVQPDLVIVQTEDVTERKIAEEKLRESELKYRNMINNLDVGFYQVTLEGVLLTHNPAFNKILGFDAEEDLKDINVTDLWQQPGQRKEYLEEMLRKNYARGYICHSLKKNGDKIILELNSHLIRDKKGNPVRIDGTFIDITDKFTLERELKESEEKFRNIAEQSLLGIAILQDGKFKYVNQRFAAIGGITPEEIKDWGPGEFLEMVHPEDRQMIAEQANKKQMGEIEVVNHYKFRGFKKTGELIYGEIYSKTIMYQGRPADFITFIDITDKIEAERKFLESEKKYRYLYENTPFSIVLINSRGKIVDCNPRTETLFGYTKADLVGKKFHKISVIHPDFLLTIMNLFKKFIKGKEVHRIDLKMYKKDNTLIWVNLQASLIRVEDEYYVQALFNDITQRKQAEFLINEEIEKLKDLDQIRKNLISRVAHELKTPLATVCGGAELFSSLYKGKLDVEQFEILSLIEKGGERLKYLVDNLIDISRIEYDKFNLNKQKSNISDLIRDCAGEMAYFSKERKISLKLEIPNSLYFDFDRIRIEQVLMNLLSNAIKNTPPKGKITIKMETINNWANISIKDTGVGLTNGEMDILFTRFGKIERFGDGLEYIDIQGSGLGLFISKEIVNLHGGTIRAESEGRNKGSNFIVQLPIT